MKKVIIAIVAALVLTGVGLTLFFMLRGGDEEKPTDGADRADIADIADSSGIVDTSDNSTAIINDGRQDNTKEESQTDVIVTVNGGTELNLTGDVGEVIRKVNESNGFVLSYKSSGDSYFSNCDKSNRVYIVRQWRSGDYLKVVDVKDYGINIFPEKRKFIKGNIYYPGGLRFSWRNDNDWEDKKINKLSLFDGWNGEKSDIVNYLNENNSIIYPIEDSVRSAWRIALFKNGKLVPINEIIDKYGEEAERVIIDYQGSLDKYYQETQNWDEKKADEYMCGWVGILDYSTKKNSMMSVLDSNDLSVACSKDAPTYPALHLEICMKMAMNEWATIDDGSIKNYGCIEWTPGQPESLGISVHCTLEDYLRIDDPYRENEDGELLLPSYMQ